MFKYIFPDWFLKKHLLETLNVFRLWAFILVNFAFTSLKPKCTIWWLSKFDQNCSHIVSTTKNKRKCFSSSFSRFGHLEREKVNPVWIPPLPPPLLSPRVCLFVLCVSFCLLSKKVHLDSSSVSSPGSSPRGFEQTSPLTRARPRITWRSPSLFKECNDNQWQSMTFNDNHRLLSEEFWLRSGGRPQSLLRLRFNHLCRHHHHHHCHH